MAMTWTAIPDSHVSAWWPIDYLLLDALRQNQFSGRQLALQGCMTTERGNLVADGDAAEDTWQDVPSGDIRIWVPEFCVGDGGTRLVVVATLSIDNGPGGNTTGWWRIKNGSDTSNERMQGASGSGVTTWTDQEFTLDFSPTAGAFNTITIQDKLSTTVTAPGAQAGFKWRLDDPDGRIYAV